MATSSATTSIRLVAYADKALLYTFYLLWDLIGDEGADETAIV